MRHLYAMRKVVREFTAPSKYYPNVMKRLVLLECGHIKRDPWDVYGNETAVKLADTLYRLSVALEPGSIKPRKCRCYQCKTGRAQVHSAILPDDIVAQVRS